MKNYIFLFALLSLFAIDKGFSFANNIKNEYHLYDIKNIVNDKNQEKIFLNIFKQNFGTYLPISEDMFQYGDKNKSCKKLFITSRIDSYSGNKIVGLYLKCQENSNTYYVQLLADIKKNKTELSTTESRHLCCLLFSYETNKTCSEYGFKEPICESETMFYGKNIINK
jgi:hypothetical protein